jgi:hypothetical protein
MSARISVDQTKCLTSAPIHFAPQRFTKWPKGTVRREIFAIRELSHVNSTTIFRSPHPKMVALSVAPGIVLSPIL